MEKKFLSVSEAARLLGMSSDWVRLQEKSGKLKAIKSGGGIRLFALEDVQKLATKRGRRSSGQMNPSTEETARAALEQPNGPEQRIHDELICETGDCPPLLPCSEIQAVCTDVRPVHYGPFRQEKLVFDFEVLDPAEFAGLKVSMYVRKDPKWKHSPVSSKLFRVSAVAVGSLPRRRRITKSLFVGKLFRCRITTTGEGAAAYSIVERITERLTG